MRRSVPRQATHRPRRRTTFERTGTAGLSGNVNAARVNAKLVAAGTHESLLVGTEVAAGSEAQVWRVAGNGATTTFTPVSGLPDVSPVPIMLGTAAADVAAQGYKQQ